MKFSTMTAAGAVFGLAAAAPTTTKRSIHKRQVPQEQSHGFILAIADEFMKLENTLNIQDAVFGLLGNAAAEEGAGDVTNFDCLKQATADQAFTNAKAISDIRGMAGALMFQAIERNTGSVGLASVLCDEPTVNPEVGALISHQDAASDNALAINKAITLELARQLATFGADPNLALLTGTFPPGDVNDNTGAGFTCDTEDRELGCIYTEGLLVLDATEEEIAAAVADVEQTFEGEGGILASDLVNLADFDVAVVDDVFDLSALAPGSGAAAVDTPGADDEAADDNQDNAEDGQAAGGNLQTFAGALGGAAPAVQNNGDADRPFEVNGATFNNEAAALIRSCDIQNNQCFNAVNGGELAGGTEQCSQQLTECQANA
ncbi:hypothetical protein CC79DRAFT_1252276, partial [Sarocladium strictum]